MGPTFLLLLLLLWLKGCISGEKGGGLARGDQMTFS